VKVCLVGQKSGPWDEGMKNLNHQLFPELEKLVTLLVVDPEECKTSIRGWAKIKAFRPDIIHYLHGPTIRSLFLCRLMRWAFPAAKIVLLAINPLLSQRWDLFLPFLAPHLILAVTQDFHQRMSKYGIPCLRVYPGVDQKKFRPVDQATARNLRQSLGLPIDKQIVIHVGHVKENRGVRVLGDLQQIFSEQIQFVVVGSTSYQPEVSIVEALRQKGVRVVLEFISRIEEFYQAADIYIFPTLRRDAAIDIPLSVLEAMAVNLPIITTRYGGLPEIFAPAPWFRYVDSKESMQTALEAILQEGNQTSQTANMVAPFQWSAFATALLAAYETISAPSPKPDQSGGR